jgi:DNA replication protein DnaC
VKAVEARLENLLEQASKKESSYADFLDELLNWEVEARRTRYMRAKLQLAHLPFVKTFEQFDFSFQPSIDERQIRELRSLRFIHEASNVIFLGPPGVGKTHLSVALAEAAIRSGLGAYFITAHDLAADLGRAYREGRLDRRMRVYLAPKVLVIDEVGYLPLDDLGTTIFFQLISAVRTRQHHSDFEQELRRLGLDLWRLDHSDGDSGPPAASLDDDEHPRRELSAERAPQGRTGASPRTGASGVQLLGLGLRCAQNAPKDGAGLHCVRGQGGRFIGFRGGEFSSGVDTISKRPEKSTLRAWQFD